MLSINYRVLFAVTYQQHSGSTQFEDGPETNGNNGTNVNSEDYLKSVLKVENGFEGNSENIQLYRRSVNTNGGFFSDKFCYVCQTNFKGWG